MRAVARLVPHLESGGIGFRLLDVGFQQLPLPEWTRRLARQVLAPLAEHSMQRSFSLRVPRSDDERWTVEITRLELREGQLDVVLNTDL